MRYRFLLCDVFTDTAFGGNPLAVLPDARGLSDRRMQQVAREFNFSESTFVLPSEAGHTRRVRIFTPTMEVPFAGHPNVGTTFALAVTGELGAIDRPLTVTFEEKAGLVPVLVERRADGSVFCELRAPQPLSRGAAVSAAELAAAVSLSPGEVRTDTHAPQVLSVGLPFLVAELADRTALERARPVTAALEALSGRGITPDVHLYVRTQGDFDLRARMFAPLDGVPEDPATGSANAALAAALATFDARPEGLLRWRIAQGVEMGRPSLLEAAVEKRSGDVTTVKIGGVSVLVAEGEIEVPGD
jgi:trans-2,3-dihydro-3-hydroxyanthranilate isomerase